MNIIKSNKEIFFANGRSWGELNSSTYNSGSIWAMKTGIESADLNMVWNEKPLTALDGKMNSVGRRWRSVAGAGKMR